MRFIAKLVHMIDFIRKKTKEDNVFAYASQATLFILISTVPFVILLLSIIQYTTLPESLILTIANDIVPAAIRPSAISWLTELYDSSQANSAVLSVAAVSTLWAASKGFYALQKGLNCVCESKETRNYFRLRFSAILHTLVFLVMIIVTLVLLVFGNNLQGWLAHRFPKLRVLLDVIISFRVTAVVFVLLIFFLLLFIIVPNRKSGFRAEFPGAVIATIGWIGFSYLFSFYIDNFSKYSVLYGSLTGIVILMIWLYSCMNILFIGAEINCYLNARKPNPASSH